MYERKETYDLNRIFDAVPDLSAIHEMSHMEKVKTRAQKTLVDFDGDMMNMDSQRYQVFKKSHTCSVCGLEGQFFAKERQKNVVPYHFNLYAILEDGTEVIFTKDHIIPKSKGGPNTLSNYETMCGPCNWAKGSETE